LNVIGFDGVFHWGWVLESIGYDKGITKIQPMDFDGVIERRFNYMIFETKDIKRKISQAQQWTLERLHKAKSVTVMKIWGKVVPERFVAECWWGNGKYKSDEGSGLEEAKNYVARWFGWANKAV